MKTLQLNHVALHVADLERSVAFYREVLKLEPMPRPDFAFPGAWFRIGENQELHLIGERTAAVISHNRGNHWAMMIDDMDAWEKYLHEKDLSLIHISEPTRLLSISYAVFCLKKKKTNR